MSKRKSPGKVFFKAAGICGVVGAVVAVIAIFASLYFSSEFTWTENVLSDLAVVALPLESDLVGTSTTSLIFNLGLASSAVLYFVFSLGLAKGLCGRVGRSGGLLLTAASVFLAGVVVFPETMVVLHLTVSGLFFLSTFLSMVLIGISALMRYQKAIGVASISFAVILLGGSALIASFNALPEFIAIIAASAWSAIMGFSMHREAGRQQELEDIKN